ncbi:MAG: hypothetical protein CMK92_06845 [Pseudomonas sp.]|nr:hypothetical protein [Pseudomonas sp.]
MWHRKNYRGFYKKSCYEKYYETDSLGRIKTLYTGGDKDIVLIGDSQLEALMVDNKNIVHNELSKLFNDSFNVYNYGLSGTGPVQQLFILKDKVVEKSPSYVIHLMNLENDFNDTDPASFASSSRPKVFIRLNKGEMEVVRPKNSSKEVLREYLAYLQVYPTLKKALYKLKSIFKSTSSTDDKVQLKSYYVNYETKLSYFRKSMELLKNDVNARGAKYKLLFWSGAETKFQDDLKTLLGDLGIEYTNISDLVTGFKNKEGYVYKCDSHWTENGHKDLAKEIYSLIVNEERK